MNHPNDVVRINISVTILGGLLRIICDHYKRINLEEYECVAVLHDIAVLVLYIIGRISFCSEIKFGGRADSL